MNVAELISARLIDADVRSVFAVAGAGHAHLLDALDQRDIKIISNRHETGAVSAADGYARTRRGLGVALIIGEQGLPNALGGLAAASLAGSPVLVIVACLPRSLIEPGSELPDAGFASVTRWSKYSAFVQSVDELAAHLDTAMAMTRHGRPGPALLFLPGHLLNTKLEKLTSNQAHDWRPPDPDPQAVEQAAKLLAEAQRPLLIAGAGAYWSNAGASLTRLAATGGIPVAANGLGRGLVPEDWQRSFSWPYAQIAASEADVVVVVGARLTQRLGFGLPPRFARDARIIQIDIHANERRRTRPIDVFIEADARAGLDALDDALADALQKKACDPQRADWLGAALQPRQGRVEEVINSQANDLHPLQLGRLINQWLPAGSIYVGDGADIQSWMYGSVAIRQSPGFMDHYPMGAMGIGTPLAVGAAAALRDAYTGSPQAPVVLVTGDGSLGFYPAELHAAARAGLRLIVIVGNDGAWGTEVHEQRQAIGREINTALGQLAYEKLAEAFACQGLRAETLQQTRAALDQALLADGPVLINVLLDVESGAQLKADPLLRMIQFSDLAEGRRMLQVDD